MPLSALIAGVRCAVRDEKSIFQSIYFIYSSGGVPVYFSRRRLKPRVSRQRCHDAFLLSSSFDAGNGRSACPLFRRPDYESACFSHIFTAGSADDFQNMLPRTDSCAIKAMRIDAAIGASTESRRLPECYAARF